MIEKIEVLNYVASTGGLKFESDKSKWINPASEIVKSNIISNLDKVKSLIGQNVKVVLDDKENYVSIEPADYVEEKYNDFQDGTNLESNSLAKKEHIINLQGKEYITFAGLLDVAHKIGLESIKTELVSISDDLVVFKAEVTIKGNKVFTGYGDATKDNVNKMILNHRIRMSETRSVARALRWATNIGMTAYEELGGD